MQDFRRHQQFHPLFLGGMWISIRIFGPDFCQTWCSSWHVLSVWLEVGCFPMIKHLSYLTYRTNFCAVKKTPGISECHGFDPKATSGFQAQVPRALLQAWGGESFGCFCFHPFWSYFLPSKKTTCGNHCFLKGMEFFRCARVYTPIIPYNRGWSSSQ